MEFIYATGGREKYFKTMNVGDCCARAIANATGMDYIEVYDTLKKMAKEENVKNHCGNKRSSVRDGVFKETWKKFLDDIGWVHESTMEVGSRKRMHLNENELPSTGTYIVQVSKHLTCIKDGVLYDTYDCSREGERMVYGLWRAPSTDERNALEDARRKEEELKARTEEIRKSHKTAISRLEKKIKELNHQLTLERNREKREIEKLNKSYESL